MAPFDVEQVRRLTVHAVKLQEKFLERKEPRESILKVMQ